MVAVHVDELTGLSRYLYTGMHVDVISTGPSGNPNIPGVVTRTILQNIEVLSPGDGIEHDTKEKISSIPVFNLLVTPEQAEILSQAVSQSRIQLVLRNPLDKGNVVVASQEQSGVLPRPKAAARPRVKKTEEPKPAIAVVQPPPPPPAPILTVEVIQGAKRSVNNVAPAKPEDRK
jgi:pilus assembly protein CpaB